MFFITVTNNNLLFRELQFVLYIFTWKELNHPLFGAEKYSEIH